MKKLFLHVIAFYISILGVHAQNTPTTDSSYSLRKLHIDEINLVSGYYHQDGDNSAVTGGIGTEKLTDFANTIDIQVSKYNFKGNKNTFRFELGVDHYTSASSDKIDPNSVSSASMSDTRVYPSLNWTHTNGKTGIAFGFTGSYSHEYDYESRGVGVNLTRISKNKNTQFDAKVNGFFDTWRVILPVELRSASDGSGSESDSRGVDMKPRTSFNASLSLSQVINPRLQALFIIEPAYQQGLLATKYQRDYFTDGTEKAETLPGKRYKLPVGIRFNYFLDDHFVIRTFYRYYMDDWGVRAHTAEVEVPVKLNSFFSLSPFYRYYSQQGTRYFTPYGQHNPSANYFTSDYDLSTLHSHYVGLNVRTAPPKGVFNIQEFKALELRYGHYIRSTGLNSNLLTLQLTF